MDSSTSTLPTALFSSITPKLIAVLEHTQRAEGVVAPQAKQALLQATMDLKNTLAQARDYAIALPGGELNFADQDELILMLEKLRNHKRQELELFAQRAANDNLTRVNDTRIEVDSTASTPFGS